MFLDEILQRNRAYVKGRAPEPLPAAEAVPLAVVACYDPRLDGLLRPALGLGEGEGFLFRTAGASVTPTSRTLRSLALAVYLFEVEQVLVVGHTSCRMASFPTTDFIQAFRRRGVSREAFGDGDLRRWAGAIASPREGVRSSAATIGAAPFLPRDLAIAGAVLDDTTGALEVVLKPGDPLPAAPPADAAAEIDDGPPAPPPLPEPGEAAGEPVSAEPELETLRGVVERLAAEGGTLDEARKLLAAITSETHPLRRLAILQHFIKRAAADSHEVREVFSRLKRQAATGGELPAETLIGLLRPLLEEGGRR